MREVFIEEVGMDTPVDLEIGKLLHTFHSGFVNWFAKFPNVPYWCVFRQLPSEVSHLHRTPLKSRQSAKIRTTVV